MKSIIQIIEAVPVPGFKPAKPPKPAKVPRPAQPSRQRAQVLTSKGRTTTVKSAAAARKPGYGFIKYLPPKGRTDVHMRPDRKAKRPKKPIKPGAFGQKTITEMKITRFEVEEKSERWSDPGVYPSGAGGSALPSHDDYMLSGYVEVTVDPKEMANSNKMEDDMDALVTKELKAEFGKDAADDAEFETKKIGTNKYRINISSRDSYQKYEGKDIKNLHTLLIEIRKGLK